MADRYINNFILTHSAFSAISLQPQDWQTLSIGSVTQSRVNFKTHFITAVNIEEFIFSFKLNYH